MPSSTDHIDFRLVRELDPTETISVEVLTKVLSHAQQVVYLLALSRTGYEVRHRIRVSEEVRAEYALQCTPSRTSSFVQRVHLEPEDTLFEQSPQDEVIQEFATVAESIGRSDWEDVRKVVPDSLLRRRLVDEMASMMPPSDAGWYLELKRKGVHFATFNGATTRNVKDYLRRLREPEQVLPEAVTIAGELIKIDFASRKLTVRHHPTSRALECEYQDEIEEMLVENRRQLLHLSGLVELDKQDQPIRMTDVFDIRDVNLDNHVVHDIPVRSALLRFREGGRTFKIRLDESGAYFLIEDPELDILVFAESREAVVTELQEQIAVLWIEYAEADEGDLTPSAVELRSTLLKHLELHGNDA